MFTKTVLIASTVGVAAGTAARVPAVAEHKELADSAKMTTTQTGPVDSSAVVTSGGWAFLDVQDCNNPVSQPDVTGQTIGECRQTSSSSSSKVTGCEWIGNTQSQMNVYTSSYTTSDCTGTATTSTSSKTGLTNGCESTYLDWKYECGTDVVVSKYGSPQHYGLFDNNNCGGNEYEWWIYFYDSCTDDSSCTSFGSYDSSKGICDDPDDVCFHVDTKIDYKGVEYTYEELKAGKEPECTVPHTPASKGVVITTSCDKTVRVTDTHLMATTKGFQLAYSLKAGDVLYGDYDKEMCTVKSVEKEKTTQQYFGLNCVHSEVLASGLRASTFGDFHTLPSWYMTYVGGLVGTETASSLGEYIAEWYFQK